MIEALRWRGLGKKIWKQVNGGAMKKDDGVLKKVLVNIMAINLNVFGWCVDGIHCWQLSCTNVVSQ